MFRRGILDEQMLATWLEVVKVGARGGKIPLPGTMKFLVLEKEMSTGARRLSISPSSAAMSVLGR